MAVLQVRGQPGGAQRAVRLASTRNFGDSQRSWRDTQSRMTSPTDSMSPLKPWKSFVSPPSAARE